ncbi:MAG: hypothetical protein RML73_01025 [Anaerolineae bacterium]|nr:hypothetical protein [Anaerolineae bacterium]
MLWPMLITVFAANQVWALTATPTPQSFIIVDAAVAFDDDSVRQAMQPLEERGLRLAVFLVQTGDTDDFLARLQALGLAQGSQLSEDVVALYAAIDTRYSEVRWNTRRYNDVIPALNLRRTAMNPMLRDGLYDQAFQRTLSALEEGLKQSDLGTPVATTMPAPVPAASSPQTADSNILVFLVVCAPITFFIGVVILIIRSIVSSDSWRSGGNSNSSSWSGGDSSSSSWSGSDSSSSWSSSDSGGSDGGSWND